MKNTLNGAPTFEKGSKRQSIYVNENYKLRYMKILLKIKEDVVG